MPRFHFHVHDERDFLDPDGIELPDEAAARIEAVRLAGGILRDEASHVVRAGAWNLEVTDAAGRRIYRIDLTVGD